jgi:hypothetical protein
VTSRAVRLRSSLLSALFLLGALGFPLADGALFHVAGHDVYAGVTHVEAHGGAHHADRCTLGLSQAPSLSTPQIDGSGLSDQLPEAPATSRSTDTPRSTDCPALPRSRAPPHTA